MQNNEHSVYAANLSMCPKCMKPMTKPTLHRTEEQGLSQLPTVPFIMQIHGSHASDVAHHYIFGNAFKNIPLEISNTFSKIWLGTLYTV